MAQQTAVEWLIEKLDNNLDINHSWRSRQYIEQAKQMEKEQIMDAYDKVSMSTPEQYYNETYGQE